MKHILIIFISILLFSYLLVSCEKEKYIGKRENGKYHGQGTLTFSNGEKYVGEFKDGEKDGQGTYTWSNGDKYVGEWKDEKRTGQGTYTYGKGEWEGDKYVGDWKDGKEWNITLYEKNGNIKRKWMNGK